MTLIKKGLQPLLEYATKYGYISGKEILSIAIQYPDLESVLAALDSGLRDTKENEKAKQ